MRIAVETKLEKRDVFVGLFWDRREDGLHLFWCPFPTWLVHFVVEDVRSPGLVLYRRKDMLRRREEAQQAVEQAQPPTQVIEVVEVSAPPQLAEPIYEMVNGRLVPAEDW